MRVRGIVRARQIIADTAAQRTEHEAPSVTETSQPLIHENDVLNLLVSKAILPVKTWLPHAKVIKITWATPRTSLPMGPAKISPASAML